MSGREKNGCRIKICGLSRPEDIEAANRLRPDYIGFVFAASRRQVTPAQAAALRRRLAPGIQTVGVFVNAPIEEILALTAAEEKGADAPVIDLIQLHGDEDEAYVRRLKEWTDKPVIRAVRVRSRQQIQEAEAEMGEYLLLDTFAKGQYGGSGLQFDWGMIPPLTKPWFLAGGISVERIPAAAACHPYAIDVSSAVETDGRKDPVKMAAAIEALRRCRQP